MKLIDYDEVRKLFAEQYKKTAQLIRDGETHLNNLAEGFTEADEVIYKLPNVDAVEVVRCKDCKHRCEGAKMCAHPKAIGWDAIEPEDDDFCSYGERKEEE